MSKIGIKTIPLSYNDIEFIAMSVRKRFEITGTFPADKFEFLIQILGVNIDIRDDIKEEGFTDIFGNKITLREDVYNGLINNEPRARFTAIHELAHKILHCNNYNLARCEKEDIPAYRDPEWQADALAGAILCPASEIKKMNMDYQDIMRIFLVSETCARKRLSIMSKISIV